MSKTTAEGPMKLSEKIKVMIEQHRHVYRADLFEWEQDASQLEQAQTWIPVISGKLPVGNDPVLGKTNNGKCVVVIYGGNEWSDEYHLLRDIVEWMPLPPSLHP